MTLYVKSKPLSLVMKNDYQGYIIDTDSRIHAFDLNQHCPKYCGTFNQSIKGQGKLLILKDELLYFNKEYQRIYAFSLEDRKQHWYYYQNLKNQYIMDVTVHKDSILLLCYNTFNKHAYVYGLDRENAQLVNYIRFLHKDQEPTSMTTYKQGIILYKDHYENVIELSEDLQSIKRIYGQLIIPNREYTYTLQNNILACYHNTNHELKVKQMNKYYVGVNTILQ